MDVSNQGAKLTNDFTFYSGACQIKCYLWEDLREVPWGVEMQ